MGEELKIIPRKGLAVLAGLTVLVGLYFASRYNYLVFHVLAEGFSVAVACGIFMMAWNSRRFMDNNYILMLGIAFLFIGSTDLLHTMSYKGIALFPGYDTNLPTQLWLCARYMQGISLLLAPLFIGRAFRANGTLGIYATVFVLLIMLVFGGYFPAAFVEGEGLTPFKIISEYVISLILVGSIFTLRAKKEAFDPKVLRLLYLAIIVTIASELAFTFYVSAFDFSNLIGHYLKLLAFVLIYRAVIVTGLREPYSLMFRNLKESETKYRSLFDNMIDGSAYHKIITDENGRPVDYEFIEVNDSFELLTGLKKEDIVGKKVTEVLPGIENDPADWIGTYGMVALTGVDARLEQRSEALNKWYSVSAFSPEPGFFATIFEDITKRKTVEEELQKYREHLEETVRERTFELQAINALLEQAAKEPSRDVYLRQSVGIIQRLSGCECVGIRVLGEGGKIPYGAYVGFSREFWESENNLVIGKDRCACTRVMAGSPEPQDASCMSAGGSFYCNDTEKFVNDLTAEDKPKFRGVCVQEGFKSIAIVPISHEGRILAAIHMADKQAGRVPMLTVELMEKLAPLIGEAVHKLELRRKLKENYADLVAANEELEQQIAERERAEAQLLQSQKMEAVGQLAGGVAHDFNNRLFAIRNYAFILKSMVGGSEGEDTADRLIASCDKAAGLVDDLLRFSREKAINPKPVEVNAIVREAMGILDMAAGKDVELKNELSKEPLQVMADTANMEHVLLNLVNNARDVMDGRGTITISTELVGAGEIQASGLDGGQSCPCAVISVSDTGPGLKDEMKDKIFDPFFTTKEPGKGTGLGLSIVYSTVKQHGGFIDVQSQSGKGTTFRIFLPLLG